MKIDSSMPRDVRDFAVKCFTGLNTPRALTAFLMLKHGEWDQLVKLRVDPSYYLDSPFGAEALKRDLQATDLLRKCQGLNTSFDTEAAAVETFWQSEKQCHRTNIRLERHLAPRITTESEGWLDNFITSVQNVVARWLGPLPEHLEGAFGPGTVFEANTWDDAFRCKTVGDKLSNIPSVTSGAREIFSHYFWDTSWGRHFLLNSYQHALPSVRGNRFTTVDKDASTDRGICIEPSANVFLQLAVGRVMKRRLKRAGIDLETGQETHRRLAKFASETGNYATIDLKAASDTVASSLVKLFMEKTPLWYDLLASLRSPATRVNERWVRLEKFSSMGNGFTFELETLIFAAICYTACRGGENVDLGRGIWVYGDDIIVPHEFAPDVLAALRYFGFTPNGSKTFVAGSFRESCGGDYFMGYDVRPYQLKEFPNAPQEWISVANGLYRRWPNSCRRFDRLYRARFNSLGNIPVAIRRLTGPSALGDLVINTPEDLWRYKVKWQQRWFKCYKPRSRGVPSSKYHPSVQLAVALYGLKPIEYHVRRKDKTKAIKWALPYRDNVTGYGFGWLRYS